VRSSLIEPTPELDFWISTDPLPLASTMCRTSLNLCRRSAAVTTRARRQAHTHACERTSPAHSHTHMRTHTATDRDCTVRGLAGLRAIMVHVVCCALCVVRGALVMQHAHESARLAAEARDRKVNRIVLDQIPDPEPLPAQRCAYNIRLMECRQHCLDRSRSRLIRPHARHAAALACCMQPPAQLSAAC
jgi:hypothetical protein